MLNVKPYKQKPGFCGPVSLRMVLKYYGLEKTEDELAKLIRCSPSRGVKGKAILKGANKLGFSGFIKDNARLEDIKKYLEKEIPVIVEWFLEDESHFSVAVKIDECFIYLQDPELADIRKIKLDAFQRVWFNFDSTFLFFWTRRRPVLKRIIVIEK